MITRRNFLLGDEIITMAYAFMMKAVVVRWTTTASCTCQGGLDESPTAILQSG